MKIMQMRAELRKYEHTWRSHKNYKKVLDSTEYSSTASLFIAVIFVKVDLKHMCFSGDLGHDASL